MAFIPPALPQVVMHPPVLDPSQVQAALHGVNTGFIAVQAEFATTFGVTTGLEVELKALREDVKQLQQDMALLNTIRTIYPEVVAACQASMSVTRVLTGAPA